MSQVTIKPDQLAREILKDLNEYTDNVRVHVDDAVGEVAKESQKKLRATTGADGSNVWRKYPTGWTTKSTRRKGYRKEEVWNARHYRLTHLLEHGHVVKNGTGRNNGRQKTRAFKHIGPINDEAQEELEKRIVEAIEKG
ncbi:MAG: hypothetical protein IJG17_06355 [Eubacterium sp.]|nr:hypothetical protein [Eubacterium sp.]